MADYAKLEEFVYFKDPVKKLMQEKALLEKKTKAQGDTIEQLMQALDARNHRVVDSEQLEEDASVLSELRCLLKETTSKQLGKDERAREKLRVLLKMIMTGEEE